MWPGKQPGMLVGRSAETGELAALLQAVRDGESRALVLSGDAGVGKTELLGWVTAHASGIQVARVNGVESERSFQFAGLHRLLMPFMAGLDRLPAPQRDALQSVFGRVTGVPRGFIVALAALALITEAAAECPLLCVVDTAQLLDRTSVEVLGYVARRLLTERVGMVFAIREGEDRPAGLYDLPQLRINGLSAADGAGLVAAAARGPVDSRISARLVTETAGNPMALLELVEALTDEELAGFVPLAEPLRIGARLSQLYSGRVQELSPEARMLLLIAAADQLGNPDKVWRAAAQLGIRPEILDLSAVERLVRLAPRVEFLHPMTRSAVYHGASAGDRTRAHGALAAASGAQRQADRRAWHLARATREQDEQAAARLEESFDQARIRGGWSSSATFLERAAELSADPVRKAERLLRAAQARLTAGEVGAARVLFDRAAPQLEEPLIVAKARRLNGQILSAAGELPKAAQALLDAARALVPVDNRLARDTLLEAFAVSQLTGESGVGAAEVMRVVQSLRPSGGIPAADADLLDALYDMAGRRYQAAIPILRAITGSPDSPLLSDDSPALLLAYSLAAAELHDNPACRELGLRWVEQARLRGAVATMTLSLAFLAWSELAAGRFRAADGAIAEGRAIIKTAGHRYTADELSSIELAILARRGREADTRALADQLLGVFTERGRALGIRVVHKSLAILELGLGNYPAAARHARETLRGEPALAFGTAPALLVEAAVMSGDRPGAVAALDAVRPHWLALGTSWTLGLLARCEALLSGTGGAQERYREAVELFRHCDLAPELAHSHLLYGQWLRRQRRRGDAGEQLRIAGEMFSTLGMDAFAERSWSELRAVGEHATTPSELRTAAEHATSPREALSAQEARIAQLAGQGAANREIAAQLFISASTVDYHLRKVFRKLGITSRFQLAQVLSELAGQVSDTAS